MNKVNLKENNGKQYRLQVDERKDIPMKDACIWGEGERKNEMRSRLFAKGSIVAREKHLNTLDYAGYTLHLAQETNASSNQDLMSYYLRSGEERKKILEDLDKEYIINGDYRTFLYSLDKWFGRTMDEIRDMATEYKNAMDEAGCPLTNEQALNHMIIRLIDGPYIGYVRETAAYEKLRRFCEEKLPGAECMQVDSYKDFFYGVDLEIVYKDKPLYGIQVKGVKYDRDVKEDVGNGYHTKNLEVTNEAYERDCKTPCVMIRIDRDFNIEDFDKVKELLELEYQKAIGLEGKEFLEQKPVHEAYKAMDSPYGYCDETRRAADVRAQLVRIDDIEWSKECRNARKNLHEFRKSSIRREPSTKDPDRSDVQKGRSDQSSRKNKRLQKLKGHSGGRAESTYYDTR